MFCPFCGTDNQTKTKFCGGCGKLLPEEATPKPPSIPKKKPADKKPVVTPAPIRYTKKIKPYKPKENPIYIVLTVVQLLLYAGISTIMILLLNMKDSVVIFTASGKSAEVPTMLSEILKLMLNGNRLFNPTVATTTLAISTYIFIYCVPVFAAICFLSSLIFKKSKAFNATFSIISILSQLTVALTIPLAILISPEFNNALAHFGNILTGDVGNVEITKIIIFVCVAAVLTIIAAIVTSIADKWRKNK